MSHHEIPLSRPDITDLEIEMVVASLRSGRLSIGPMVEQFEKVVAARCDRREGVAVNSGTSGLHLAMLALGIQPGDEVITTPFSFVASANCAMYVGARPVFADICPKTLNMDPEKLERAITPRTRAIVAVECFGNPALMEEYESIAAAHNIPLIEDCCEALGSSHAGRKAGSFGGPGGIGVFAFYPNKQITTGEGGVIVTDDKRLADLCRSMRNQGRAIAPGAASWLGHERLGYNFRMPEMCAALGVAQMRRLDDIIQKRQRVAGMYMSRLMDNHDVILPTIHERTRMSWFVFVVRLAGTYTREERDRIIAGLLRHDVGAKDYFPCIHLQPFYRDRFGFKPGDFPIAESVSTRTIALPFYNDMSERDVDHVVRTLELMIERENIRRK
ncbi:MAG TPA: DegT/DnrJ/EryC1/StrS family aminotransferase [Phycisphaerales bacterium]|jgi:perosamine synthetase|nr:DegT/DnrJ/EryC1/StrS family aminotransferase [Phycisphaerales bacterium]